MIRSESPPGPRESSDPECLSWFPVCAVAAAMTTAAERLREASFKFLALLPVEFSCHRCGVGRRFLRA